MNATEAAALQVGQRIQWSDHTIDEVVANDGAVITVKRGPGYAEMKVPPALPPRGPQPVTATFAYDALEEATLSRANVSLNEDAPPDGEIYGRDGLNGKWVISGRGGIRPPAQQIDYRIGLDDTVPGIVDLQPASPLPGEIGGINEPTPDDVVVYARKYDLAGNATWEPISVTGITIADDPPNVPPPIHGQLWYESDTGNTFIWYDDGSSAQWVQMAPGEDGGRDGPPIFYGIGLTRTGLTVDLDPATDLLLGGLFEPQPDGLSYARQYNQTTQIWEWVQTVTAGLQINTVIPDEVKIGVGEPDVLVHCYGKEFTPTCVLYWSDGINPAQPIPTSAYVSALEMTFLATPSQITQEQLYTITVQDPMAVAPDPVLGAGAVPFQYVESLKVAGETIDDLGIVYIPPDQGLQVAPDGQLAAVVASESKYGVILDPPFGQATWVRHGEGRWVPAPLPTQIAGHTPADLGIVFVPERTQGQGLTLEDDGGLYLRIATDQHLGGILEPSETGRQFARQVDDVTKLGEWVEVQGGMDEPPMDPVQTWGRSSGGARGWLPIPDSAQGMEEPPMSPVALWARSSGGARGWLEIPEPPPAIDDVPADPAGRQYTRQHGNWHPVPPPTPAPRPAGKIEAEIGVVFVPDRLGLAVGPDGQLALQPAEADQIGGLREVPGPGEWVRKQGAWEQYVPPDAVTFRYGLQQTGDIVDITPPVMSDPAAGVAPELGGVYGTLRSERNGIAIDSNGHISTPLATPDLAGSIVEPPADAKGYVRTTQLDGTSQWVPPAPSDVAALVPVGRSPMNGLENGYDDVLKAQTIWVPLATDFLAGAIVEPPTDGLRYARTNDTMNGVRWVPASSAAGVYVSDVPPATPEPNQLWFESDSSNLFLYYTDVDSSQWVQVNIASAPLTGVQEAPTDGQAYVRQSAAWVVDAGGLADAPSDGTEYLRKDGAWVNPTTTGGAFLPLTGGTITGDLVVTGQTTLGPTLNFPMTSRINAAFPMPQIDWANSTGVQSTMFIQDGRLTFAKPGGGGDLMRLIHATQIVDFANRPTVNGTPVVMMADHQSALDRITQLEDRLATLEAR